ncbi:hypothetical protein NSK_005787 [Nannochloropsis salina CCMP1776]|uniref:Uncharacterized protein n=1 Tax=Nannochloropsis salina CCMP1776 TaxID=1027361 RepID=A0A4D9D2N4_9STRA|nr:hypothetical protein NSK_005787 [Nannochloropsis salina CCMP1776]|eukprot:TFJ82908.1 hypothetical protein NSK_005787 [Nannochloropsis salina CCMP1776]
MFPIHVEGASCLNKANKAAGRSIPKADGIQVGPKRKQRPHEDGHFSTRTRHIEAWGIERRRQPLVLGFSERHARGFDGKLTAITTRCAGSLGKR